MTTIIVNGVDPGLVHTGLVSLVFMPEAVRIKRYAVAIDGPDAVKLGDQIDQLQTAFDVPNRDTYTFIEDYKPRSNFNTDKRMTKAVVEMKAAVPGSKVLPNMGVKKIIKRPLMDLLECWKFATLTHHQDLRSAARIGLLGMVKDDRLNELLTQVVHDHLAGETWNVLPR